MGDETYRQRQWDSRQAPHIAPINDFVDEVAAASGRAGVPYVAPALSDIDLVLVRLASRRVRAHDRERWRSTRVVTSMPGRSCG